VIKNPLKPPSVFNAKFGMENEKLKNDCQMISKRAHGLTRMITDKNCLCEEFFLIILRSNLTAINAINLESAQLEVELEEAFSRS